MNGEQDLSAMKLFAAFLVSVLALGAAEAAAQSTKVAVVNLARIQNESVSGKRVKEVLVAEFEPRNRKIEEFQKRVTALQNRLKKEGERMSPSEREALGREVSGMMQKSDQMLRALTDEYEVRRRELVVKVIDEARAAIKSVAEAGKYDLILQEAAFARPSVDITDQVLKEMAKRGR